MSERQRRPANTGTQQSRLFGTQNGIHILRMPQRLQALSLETVEDRLMYKRLCLLLPPMILIVCGLRPDL